MRGYWLSHRGIKQHPGGQAEEDSEGRQQCAWRPQDSREHGPSQKWENTRVAGKQKGV